jgi:mannan endo-1,4-beta-mannosidase
MGRRKVRLRIATLAAGMITMLGLAVPAAETATASPVPWGLYQASDNLQYSLGSSVPNYGIEYYSWTSSGTENFDVTSANAAYKNNVEPFVELQPCTSPCTASGGGGYSLVDVANGVYDSSLSAFNSAVASWGHPLLMTFAHEMNGNWYPWGYQSYTTAQWIAAWDHVTSIINAPNVTWVWAPNINTTSYHPLSSYWPGASYVGMCGIDGYLSSSTNTWSNTIATSVSALKSTCRSKPWVLAETGVNDTDSNAVSQIDNLVSNASSSGASAIFYFDKYNWLLTSAMQSEFLGDVG